MFLLHISNGSPLIPDPAHNKHKYAQIQQKVSRSDIQFSKNACLVERSKYNYIAI